MNIILIVLTLWHCSWTTGSRTWPGTLCSSHQPTCGIFWFGWQWWYWWWWWCGGCAYAVHLVSSDIREVVVKDQPGFRLRSHRAQRGERQGQRRPSNFPPVMWRHYWLVWVDGKEILRYQCLWKYLLRYSEYDEHADIFHVLEADNLVFQYFSWGFKRAPFCGFWSIRILI